MTGMLRGIERKKLIALAERAENAINRLPRSLKKMEQSNAELQRAEIRKVNETVRQLKVAIWAISENT